jgi:hypothetical protein
MKATHAKLAAQPLWRKNYTIYFEPCCAEIGEHYQDVPCRGSGHVSKHVQSTLGTYVGGFQAIFVNPGKIVQEGARSIDSPWKRSVSKGTAYWRKSISKNNLR